MAGALLLAERMEALVTRDGFRTWLENLADASALIPAEEVLQRLPPGDEEDGPDPHPLADLSAEDAGKVLDRSASTVRDYCRQDLLPGAYRQRGREWRIPRDAIRAFQRNQRSEARNGPSPRPTHRRRPEDADLGAWREELER